MALRVSKNCQKFGSPLYAGGFVANEVIVMAGGGGRSATGIANRVMLASIVQGILSDPDASLTIPTDCPIALAIHPNGRHLIAPLGSGGCSYLVADPRRKTLVLDDAQASSLSLSSIGTITRASYSSRGSLLVLGTTQGALLLHDPLPPFAPRGRIDQILRGEIKDLDVLEGEQGIWIVAIDEHGTCAVIDASIKSDARTPPASMLLTPPAALGLKASVSRARFVANTGSLVILMHSLGPKGRVAHLGIWTADRIPSPSSLYKWTMSRHFQAHPDAATALAVTRCGSYIATGSVEGDVYIIDGNRSSRLQKVRGAHMIAITGAFFSPDSKTLLTVSADSSARCTPITGVERRMGVAAFFMALLEFFLVMVLLGVIIAWLDSRGLLMPHLTTPSSSN